MFCPSGRNLEEDGFWNRWQTQPPSGPNSSTPPQVIDSGFYPKLGCYSSTNISVIDLHMRMIRKAGIGEISSGDTYLFILLLKSYDSIVP